MNYIIIIIKAAEELLKAVTPQVNPNGYIFVPPVEKKVSELVDNIVSIYRNTDKTEKMFNFSVSSKEYFIPYENIIFFESARKKIIIRTASQEIECYHTFSELLGKVPDNFVQIHKSYIINLSHVRTINYSEMYVEFEDGSTAYISRTYKNDLRKRFEGNKA